MAWFPKIHSPCPYKANLASVMDSDFCNACERNVYDISAMSDGERRAFLSDCQEDVCVSYGTLGKLAAAALGSGMMAMAAPAAAQDTQGAPTTDATTQAAPEEEWDYGLEIIVGGIRAKQDLQWEEHQDKALPMLPVITDAEDV